MKKYYKFIFMALFGLFVFLPKDAYAFELAVPTTYGGQRLCNVSGENCYTEEISSSTSGLYNGAYTSQWYYTGAFWSWVVYDFGDIAYCSSDSTLTISGTLYPRNAFDTSFLGSNPVKDVTAYMNSTTSRTQCSYSYNNNIISYSCSGKGGGNLALIFDVHGPYPATDFLLTKNVSLSCSATNGDIINSNNQNTQNIITNDNANTDKIIDNENKNHEEDQETKKGIWETIKELPSKFMDMLKSLFIPEDDYFSNKFDELMDNITGILGFLAYSFTLVVETFEFFLTVEDTGSYVISWPDVSVPNFEEFVIIEGGSFDLGQLLENPKVASLRNIAFVFINALLLLAFLQLCKNKYAEVFGGQVSETEFISVSEEYDIDYHTGEVSNIKHIEKKTTRRDIS